MTRSEEQYERACGLMPGGVNSPVRAFRSVGGTPIFFDRASGAHFTDIDGNRSYIGRSGAVSGFIGDSRSNAIVTMADTTANRIFAQGACAPMLTVN